jgi:hypothetical protein
MIEMWNHDVELAASGIDLPRLERSLALRTQRVGHGQYEVSGGAGSHWVDLYGANQPRCDCGDHLWREQVCKHILAALLREGNEGVVGALGHLVATLRGSGSIDGTTRAA